VEWSSRPDGSKLGRKLNELVFESPMRGYKVRVLCIRCASQDGHLGDQTVRRECLFLLGLKGEVNGAPTRSPSSDSTRDLGSVSADR
jgi:hypothetical protein